MRNIVYIILSIALSLVTLNAKSYKYDDLNRVIEVAYKSGEKIHYSYDSAGNMLSVEYKSTSCTIGEGYKLNNTQVTDQTIIAKIKLTVEELESIKLDLDNLKLYTGDKLKQEYDKIKKRLDDAKKLLDDVKQAIDNSDEDKVALKKEADEIKKALDDVKKVIDGYKQDEDNADEAIEAIKAELDIVKAMMVGSSESCDMKNYLDIPKGRTLISGYIDITKLPTQVHSVWIVENGYWYGYSPDKAIRDEIKKKYKLIDTTIESHKGVFIYATEDTQIEMGDKTSDVPHVYRTKHSIHGADGKGLGIEEIKCEAPKKLVVVVKLKGEELSAYAPDKSIDGVATFDYVYENDGYYVICEE